MEQNFEYPMWTPHKRALLFKRYTGDIPILLDNEKVISIGNLSDLDSLRKIGDNAIVVIEGNRYVYSGRFKWIENTAAQSQNEQPINGLLVENTYITIKTNSLIQFETGDIIRLPDGAFAGLWTITDGITKDYTYTPKQVQTFQYIPLSSLG